MSADRLDKEYDFIVVGSGAGGGPVAVRLAEAGYSVLILEAGGEDEPYDYKVPAFHARSSENNELAWKFYVHHYADPSRRSGIQRTTCRARESSIRARARWAAAPRITRMIFIAPHNSDWNDIAKLTGDKSWRGWRMRKYFQKLERCEYLNRPWYRQMEFRAARL